VRTVAIIQARMGSTRLPGKVLKDICGKPLLFHIISRAQRLKTADEIVLATTTEVHDEPLISLAQAMGVTTIRGPEDNVLKRFLMSVDATKADIVIRICSDSPLFDPAFIDQCVSLLKEHDADLVALTKNVPTAYEGASAISVRALLWTWEVARDDPLAYEHVTAYAKAHSDQLRVVSIDPDPELVGDFHLSIDTMADLELMRHIYQKLYVPEEIVSLRDAVRLLRARSMRTK
jgi:spore coat polysaccharide biosynthesis protein SpsF